MNDIKEKAKRMVDNSKKYLSISEHSSNDNDKKNKYLLALVLLALTINVYKYADNDEGVFKQDDSGDLSIEQLEEEEQTLEDIKQLVSQDLARRAGIVKSEERLYSSGNKIYFKERIDDDGNFIYELYILEEKEKVK